MTLELNFLYVPSMQMGYGRAGTMIAHELAEMGVDVYNHLEGTVSSEVLAPDARGGRSNVVCWMGTPQHARKWWKGQTPTIFTMWESMRLPEAFRESLKNLETVVVPSFQNLELFSQFHPNVKYVPLGIDPNVWSYRERQRPTSRFNFLIAGSGSRKGTDLAVKAFQRLYGKDGSWGDGPVPYLMMKNTRAEKFYGSRIEMYSGKIPAEDELGLYAQAHCYLQPARGEGFGLQPLQAIAQGCPTILTGAHGHASFQHLGMPLTATPTKSDYFIMGDAGDWWEPDFDELCERMAWVYDNYNEAVARAAAMSQEATTSFTWKITADGLLDALGRDRLGPYEGPDEWTEPELDLFLVVTEKDHHCNIGGTNFFFEAGKEYMQVADVKRTLFEADMLSPACLDDNDPRVTGLAPQQVARLGLYRAEHSRCPTCGQSINDLRQEADA